MKNIKIRFFILCLCLSVTGYTSASARTEKVKTDIDWPAFMQKIPHSVFFLWYIAIHALCDCDNRQHL